MTTDHATSSDGPVALAPLGLLGTIVVLHLLGRGGLAAPPLAHPSEIGRWLDQRDALDAAFALLRLALLAVGYHLVATTVLVLLGRALRAPGLEAWADAWTLPMFRGIVGRTVGVLLSVAALAGGGPTAAAAPSAPPASTLLTRIDLPPEPAPATAPTEGAAILHRLPAPGPQPAPAPAEAVPDPPTTHLVEPGDHLWSISEARLAQQLGRPPSDAELAPYWAQVVAANPQLADPDLIHPGETVNVPPPPGP